MLDNLMENPEHVLNFFANPSCKNHQVVVPSVQSYIYQVLQTIQMKLILLGVWAEPAILGSIKTALKL